MGFGVEELRDAEIEQARPAVLADQQMSRLQIAMHDAALVGERDRFEHGEKELDPAPDRKRRDAASR